MTNIKDSVVIFCFFIIQIKFVGVDVYFTKKRVSEMTFQEIEIKNNKATIDNSKEIELFYKKKSAIKKEKKTTKEKKETRENVAVIMR